MIEKANAYNERFESMSAEGILRAVLEMHAGKVAFSTSLGAEDQVLTHLLAGLGSGSFIFTLDTGRMFPETYELIEKTVARYGIRIKAFFPDTEKVEEMVLQKGINLFYHSVENRKLCCNIRKIEPLKRALSGYEIWITGLRRDQSLTRNHLSYASWDEANQVIKVNPLLNWSEQDVWDFIRAHRVPYNTLHDKGFPSIGCQPCTRAVQPGEDIRSGRWWWERPESRECGLHPLGGDQVVE